LARNGSGGAITVAIRAISVATVTAGIDIRAVFRAS
jgi:hypothetical protein